MNAHSNAHKAFAILLALLGLLFNNALLAQAAPFSFAVMGDQPYDNFLEAATGSLIQSINTDPEVQWILHVGDIKSGSEPCTNELLKRRLTQLRISEKPLVYIPGDNEWTDCHRTAAGNFDSQERLRFLRQQAFSGSHTLGQKTFATQHQTSHDFPEHLMWKQGSTLFLTLNVPGSNNDLKNPDSRKTGEKEVLQLFKEREEAIDAWLKAAQSQFSNPETAPTETVVAIQGNPLDGSDTAFNLYMLRGEKNGYTHFLRKLVKFIDTTQRPLLLVHGDTHRFKWDKPDLTSFGGTSLSNALFYRVEGWGHPFLNSWVKVSVKPGEPIPFAVNSISLTAEPNN